jgi:hypothetical protein
MQALFISIDTDAAGTWKFCIMNVFRHFHPLGTNGIHCSQIFKLGIKMQSTMLLLLAFAFCGRIWRRK